MTPQAALIEVIERLGARQGAAVLVSEHELGLWPGAAVKAMKAQHLLTKASPASSAVCPGCERECVMPVHVRADRTGDPKAFIVCDKRSDINRVGVPVIHLDQWQATGASMADLLTGLLGLVRRGASGVSADRWEIGVLRGQKHASHLVLLADGRLILTLAGHSIILADVLTFEDDGFVIDKLTLIRLVEQPIAGAGDRELAAQRIDRLKKRKLELTIKGDNRFLKTIAKEEGISVSRVKQLLGDKVELPEGQVRGSALQRTKG